LRRLEAVVAAAETEPSAEAARDALVVGMVNLAASSAGRQVSAILSDPLVVSGSFSSQERYRDLILRMRRLLMGEASQEPRIRTATLIAALNGAAMHPFVAEYDEDTLRSELLQIARLLLPPLSKQAATPLAGRSATARSSSKRTR
jgi:hypothetical protein